MVAFAAIPDSIVDLDCASLEGIQDDMANFPRPLFSKNEVNQAGKELGGAIPAENYERALDIFRIAYEWRGLHLYPMRKMRRELARISNSQKAEGIVTAGRLKRMQSIRRKLSRISTKLTQIQDLGGCRAIVESISDVENIVSAYNSGASRHVVKKSTNYIKSPRSSGYRTHHLIMKFVPQKADEEFLDGRLIELQIRTRLQHSWATAVEAVGLFLGEDLKGGEGSPLWLRFFKLMSAELAAREGCLLESEFQDESNRREEIKRVEKEISAIGVLNNLSYAFRSINNYIGEKPGIFLIQYDNSDKTVRVKSYTGIKDISNGIEQYGEEEQQHSAINTVFVEVDKVNNLRAAYPNYYGDVQDFTDCVREAVNGQYWRYVKDWTEGKR